MLYVPVAPGVPCATTLPLASFTMICTPANDCPAGPPIVPPTDAAMAATDIPMTNASANIIEQLFFMTFLTSMRMVAPRAPFCGIGYLRSIKIITNNAAYDRRVFHSLDFVNVSASEWTQFAI
jgi:hypothetical protein